MHKSVDRPPKTTARPRTTATSPAIKGLAFCLAGQSMILVAGALRITGQRGAASALSDARDLFQQALSVDGLPAATRAKIQQTYDANRSTLTVDQGGM